MLGLIRDGFWEMLGVSHCDEWILIEVKYVSLWWMVFLECWVCLIVMNGFWWLLSVSHWDRWILMEVGCVSLWWMDFDDCWVSLIITDGFWWLLNVYYCDRWILMAVECLAVVFFLFTNDMRLFSWVSWLFKSFFVADQIFCPYFICFITELW